MISIIICSRLGDISDELRSNIDATIGCEYELVIIDNSERTFSIFAAYNNGIRRANGDVLCFMHEDIRFHSNDWGRIVLSIFSDNSIGMIGVSGCHLLPQAPIYWPESPFITSTNFDRVNGVEYHDSRRELLGAKPFIDVVACDGMWFCIPKQLIGNLLFDTKTYEGFHLYDMDISLQVQKEGKRVVVANGIVVEHRSRGTFDEDFRNALNAFFIKWSEYLPISRGLSDVPRYTLSVINELYVTQRAYENNYNRVVHSRNFRYGYLLLYPFRKIVTLFRHR